MVKTMNHSRGFELPYLERNLRQALRQWHGPSHTASPLADLYLFRQTERTTHANPRQVTNQILLQALETLRKTHESAASLLQKRYLDAMSVIQLANQLNVAESTVYTMQREAIQMLADTMRSMEWEASAAQKDLLTQRLPAATYTNLIGVDEHLEHLLPRLAAPQPPWVIAIEGIGGIGKTSLAHALTCHVIEQALFDEVGWVSAQQARLNLGGALHIVEVAALSTETLIEKLYRQLLPTLAVPSGDASGQMFSALHARVKAIPHLIVVDNLETVVDVESLLPTIQQLTNPTKFVLTSRQRVAGEANIYHVPMRELSQPAALQLVRQEAEFSNLPVLATSSDADLLPIVETVGGNPLAIRLVVGQTHAHSLEAILADLRCAHGQPVENLYNFIYRAAWEKLDARSKRVLLIMPLASPLGDTLDYLAQVGDLASGDLRQALDQLVRLNLVDARGGLNERRYSIHSLTRTFLQKQVAKW